MKLRNIFFLALLSALLSLPVKAVTRRALIIGLGEQMDNSWGKIHGDNDVAYMEQLLRRAGYTDIRKLKNEQATKAKIVSELRSLASRCQRGDHVYVHYSGHGQLMTDLNGDEALRWSGSHADWDEAWIPYDAFMYYGAQDRGEKHLSDDELAVLLTAIRKRIGTTGRLTVSVDACHSGDATCGEQEEAVRGVDTKFVIPRTAGAKQEKPLAERWQTISACKPYQLCTEMKDRKVGKLTYALFTIGAKALTMGNEKLESQIEDFMKQNKGRLPQNPMVTGRR